MKLEFLSFDFDKFAQEMQNLKDKKGFDYLTSELKRVSVAYIFLKTATPTSVAA